eukprot:5434615-Pleurochrysis_carterae.AAC.2
MRFFAAAAPAEFEDPRGAGREWTADADAERQLGGRGRDARRLRALEAAVCGRGRGRGPGRGIGRAADRGVPLALDRAMRARGARGGIACRAKVEFAVGVCSPSSQKRCSSFLEKY